MLKPKPSTSVPVGMLHLTPEDVQRLMTPDHSGAARMHVTEKLTDAYVQDGYNAMEAVLAEQIFRLLARDTEVKVRSALAERLKHSVYLPKDIVMTMARDAEDMVALPVLQYSEILTEDDLIALVEAMQTASRQIAVSERREVPSRLAQTLLNRGRPEVAQALVKNRGAHLGEHALEDILERYSRDDQLMRELAGRRLPPAVAEKMIAVVSEGVAQGLRTKYGLKPQALRAETKQIHEAGVLLLLKPDMTPFETEKLVEQLAFFGRLTPSLIIMALGHGHMHFFEMSLGQRSELPPGNVHTLLNDRGDLGFRALYNKVDLPPELYGAFRHLFAAAHTLLEKGERPGDVFARAAVRELRQREDVENMDALIRLLEGE